MKKGFRDMDEKLEQAATYYTQSEVKGMIDHDIDTGDMKRAFIAGAEWAEKKSNHKDMCFRDRTKTCNLCHECDVDVLNPNY